MQSSPIAAANRYTPAVPPDVPAGIDLANLSAYFAATIPGGDAPLTATLIAGGKSNLTYKVTSNNGAWIVRRPPLGHILPTAHDMGREFRVQHALRPVGVPVPNTLALCTDTAVIGAPFYVMEFCDGEIIAEEVPTHFATDPAERRAISHALIESLVALHAVDYNAAGLGDFGRPDGYLERQVRRWSEQWERSETRPIPAMAELIRRLRGALPASPAPTIVHGDYRLGNLILDRAKPGHILAILDWEMATLGDPLADLGYVLLYWGEPGDSPSMKRGNETAEVTRVPGYASRAEMAALYARLSGRDISNIEYYHVFSVYKLAVIYEGIHARFLKGETVGEGFEGYGQRVENLVRAALELADAAESPALRGHS